MKKSVERLILAGGIASVFWGLFHIAAIPPMVAEMVTTAGGKSAAGVSDLASFLLLFNACTTAFLLGMGAALILGRKSAGQTLFGSLSLAMMVVFWVVRLVTPYFLLPEGVTVGDNISMIDAFFVVMAALYLIPLLMSAKRGAARVDSA